MFGTVVVKPKWAGVVYPRCPPPRGFAVTDALFFSKVSLLKRLGWLSVAGVAIIAGAFALGTDAAHPKEPFALVGAFAVVPAVVYFVIFTIWHWKGRYRGSHSDLWGALLLVETSGWFKLIYLFRHIIPDARGTGRYVRDSNV